MYEWLKLIKNKIKFSSYMRKFRMDCSYQWITYDWTMHGQFFPEVSLKSFHVQVWIYGIPMVSCSQYDSPTFFRASDLLIFTPDTFPLNFVGWSSCHWCDKRFSNNADGLEVGGLDRKFSVCAFNKSIFEIWAKSTKKFRNILQKSTTQKLDNR